MSVLIRRLVRNGEAVEESVLWPKGWPLPAEGSILLGHEVSGRVEHCEFDLDRKSVV